MNRVFHKICKVLRAHVLFLIICHVSLLLKHVIKSGCPLSAAQSSCVTAVVHHESYSPGMHVGIEGVHSLQVSQINAASSVMPKFCCGLNCELGNSEIIANASQ